MQNTSLHIYNLIRHRLSYICKTLDKRNYLSTISTKNKVAQSPVYTKRDEDFRTAKKIILKTLEQLLHIKPLEAHEILINNRKFHQTSKSVIQTNHAIYKENNINNVVLFKYPNLLVAEDTELKIEYIKNLPLALNDTIILVNLNIGTLKKHLISKITLDEITEKIQTLSKALEVSVLEACSFIVEKQFLLSLYVQKINKNMEILLEYKIPKQDICNDLWVLKYSESLIRTRFDLAREHNIEELKTWMVRAGNEAFQTYIQRRSDNRSILGDNSLAEYLSERLDCNVATANYMILKQPALKNKSLKKLKELIDFLYGAGFHASQICRVPKILVHSIETTRKRLKQLEEKGLQIDGLSVLTKSQNQFMAYFEALLKIKNKSK